MPADLAKIHPDTRPDTRPNARQDARPDTLTILLPGRLVSHPPLHCRTNNTSFTSFHIVPDDDFQPSSGSTRALRPRGYQT